MCLTTCRWKHVLPKQEMLNTLKFNSKQESFESITTILISGFAHIFSFTFKWSQNFEFLSKNDKFGTLSHKLFPKWLFCAIFCTLSFSLIYNKKQSFHFFHSTNKWGIQVQFCKNIFFPFRPGLGQFDRLGRLTLK